MTRIYSIVAVATIAVSAIFYGLREKPPQVLTDTQKAAIAKLERKKELRKGGKCPDTEILVDIDGYTLKVSRQTTAVSMTDGTYIPWDELQYRCDVKHIKNGSSIAMGGFGIASRTGEQSIQRQERLKRRLEKYQDQKQVLTNGIIRLGDKYYILPLDKSPTGDSKPIVFECDRPEVDWSSQYSGGCETFYEHPTGLKLIYSFATGSRINETNRITTADDLIVLDNKQRQRLEDMIINTRPEGDMP